MKLIILFLISACLFFSSCVKENTPTIPVDDRPDTTSTSVKTGIFQNGPFGSVSGTARIVRMNNILTLALENVVISNGPDLHVYISKEVQPVNYIDLGRLQSTMGNQLYAIQGNPDFSQYKYALIHCQRFNHLFGSAELR